ncbi:MAG: hypothetical protein ACRD6I_03995 [Candidatus Acidiferrales bacterium]
MAQIQTSPCTSTNTPGVTDPKKAWPQNAPVTVNISSGFSAAEFNCLKQVFDNINVQNTAAGNSSGVFFSVTQGGSPAAQVTVDPQTNSATAENAPGVSFGLQVNSKDLGFMTPAVTWSGNNGTNRTSAVIEISPRITNCTADQMSLAHEIGHTLSLGECHQCSQGASAMNQVPCASFNSLGQCTGPDWNNSTYGRTNLSPCDNSKVQQNGQYDPSMVNQPIPNAPEDPPEDPCGAECTCGADCNADTGECMLPVAGDDPCTPIIIAVGSNSSYHLTSPDDGVSFDMNGDGIRERMSWTQAGDPIAFLVLDRNGNGNIDDGTELFGNHSVVPSGQPVTNGFEALAWYDQNGGNSDGIMDARDPVWPSLRLWIDWNHDAVTQDGEFYPLEQWQLGSISLQFQTIGRKDGHGNMFRLKAPCQLGNKTRFGYDVYFSMKPQKKPR